MPLIEWALTDNISYAKAQEKIDEIILCALVSGPKRATELIDILRIAGYGNARNDGPLELSYSMTGAIYRSAYNSLRSRGMVCDSYDKDGRNYARPALVYSRSQLLASERARDLAPAPAPTQPEAMA